MAHKKPVRDLAPLEGASAIPASYSVLPEIEEAAVPLAHYLWVLRRHGWKIAALIAGAVISTLVISYRLTPIYESTAAVDFDRRTPTGVVGREAAEALNNDADQFMATQVRMIQSDSVLRPVAQRFRLLDRDEERWGTPEEQASRADSPILLKKLKVLRPTNTYLLQISYRSRDRELAAGVANAVAQSYLEHTFNIRYKAAAGLSRFMEKQIEELHAKMERSSDALASYERELNIISPEEKTNILSARLLELNTEYTRAQSDRVRREAAWDSARGGGRDAALASSQGEALKKLAENVNAAREKFSEIRAHFGPNHPDYKVAAAHLEELQAQEAATASSIARQVEVEYREALRREKMLEEAVAQVKGEFDDLNARSFEYQALKREAEGDKRLYEELLRRIKEETINASFQNQAARIADPARPGREPVFPNIKLNLALALLFSTMIGVGAAVLSDVLDDTIRDPDQVRRSLRTEVVGTLPQVKTWKGQVAGVQQLAGLNGVNGHGGINGSAGSASKAVQRASQHSLTTYEEAIRTLRNSILLADFGRQMRTLLVTSASPSEGKSTIAIHLAIAHAQQHQRTLIVDGDLRRPSVHKRFNLTNRRGLSDVLTARMPWQEAVQQVEGLAGLDVLPAGAASQRKAADMVGAGLGAILDEAAAVYDLIVVDAPPLLGFPEPLQMAAAVDGVLIVARAGETSRRGVSQVLGTLHRLRAGVVGVVLNEVTRGMSSGYYYYNYYRKYYGENLAEKNGTDRHGTDQHSPDEHNKDQYSEEKQV